MEVVFHRISFLEIPAKEKVEHRLPGDRLEIGFLGKIEPQDHHISYADPEPGSEASIKLVEMVFPGISHIEKKCAPYRSEADPPEGKPDQQIIYQRKTQFVIYQ